ncbi:MAG: hypothetical protein JSV27_11895 [Candidatus Bathyarchaeota archaeon]|nr:MAG: hypothetical protein JSV27_11895 [Candidatus Bathyarchaeota archaeon]
MISKQELKDRVIRIIAATRFPFVDQTDWGEGYVTITNDGGRRVRGINGLDGYIFPSIVITKENTDIQEIGEVELEDGVTEANVANWKLMSETAGMGRATKKFFLYVPEGTEEKAERLLENNGIAYAGLRSWAVKGGSLVITPIKTPDSPKDHR